LPNDDGIIVAAVVTNVTIGGAASGVGGASAAGRNIISGNTSDGVDLFGEGEALVRGNFIGTDAAGARALPNGRYGVLIQSNRNTVGGTTAGAGNLISGNGASGVATLASYDSRSFDNQIDGNYIGTDKDGAAALPNRGDAGVSLAGDGGNVVQDNVISGNAHDGVLITSSINFVKGGFIGTNATGTLAVPNQGVGVHVARGYDSVIGARIVISGNGIAGVLVEHATATRVAGNRIGTNFDGSEPIQNGRIPAEGGWGGVIVDDGAVRTTIGGTAAYADLVPNGGNIISGNLDAPGVFVRGNANATVLEGNLIGSPFLGSPTRNAAGVIVRDPAANTTIGGTAAGAGNVISGNRNHVGIGVLGKATGTQIQGNLIGVMRNDMVNGNGLAGIFLFGSTNTTIGGTAAAARNVISSNHYGIWIDGAAGTTILGNLIGTDQDGKQARANHSSGIYVENASGVTIGAASNGNVISGNRKQGILLEGASDVTVVANFIGVAPDGRTRLANGSHGILLSDTSDVTIGGPGGLGNVIAGNTGDGLRVAGASDGTRVLGNWIGVGHDGTTKQANAGNGINITGTARNTTIGGLDNAKGNVISGNTGDGVNIGADTSGTLLQSNTIGLNQARTAAVANGGNGVNVVGSGVTLGGAAAGAGNVISGNTRYGIEVAGARAAKTLIEGNMIGTDGTGKLALGNGDTGIYVHGADDVQIGGPAALTDPALGAGNLIVSGNLNDGVQVFGGAGALVQGNRIGTNLDGTLRLGDSRVGVRLDTTTKATVGGTAANTGNLISGNLFGVVLDDDVLTLLAGNLIGTNAAGSAAVANRLAGVSVGRKSARATIGSPGSGNLIAGNAIGIDISRDATGVVIQANRIGIAAVGNKGDGVLVDGAAGVSIGGTVSGERNTIVHNEGNGVHLKATKATVIVGNVIGANSENGVLLENATGTGVLVNRIGTNDAGTDKLANGGDGVLLKASSSSTIRGNLISGNTANGVELVGSNNNRLEANKIGTQDDGTAPLGNGGFGVFARDQSSSNTVGGTTAGSGNVIAFNAKGVVVGNSPTDNSVHNSILGNSIFSNRRMGIDLGNHGVTPNDNKDQDSGPNGLQNYPALKDAKVSESGADLTVMGTLNSGANQTYRVEFFAQATGDPSGFGQGQIFLGFADVTTDASGQATFSVTLSGVHVRSGQYITATATGPKGDTSEFSRWVIAV
jgi:parallel beta-helix repeat protein